ncbi:glycosyltransferase family 4 protein [Streptomyces sp. V4I23]|uniref:glycosyltransferase family 4 protein n=1 Tax=Streptomyces sp. V4I23 TaxID=3042282 RepID=UPI00358EEBF8
MPGGMERHVECLTREQLSRGHRVTLAFRHGTSVPDGAARLSLSRTALSRLLAPRSDRAAFAAEASATIRQLVGGPHAHGVDLLHLHGDHVEGPVAGPLCRRLGIPLCMTFHASSEMNAACCERWWTSLSTDHDPVCPNQNRRNAEWATARPHPPLRGKPHNPRPHERSPEWPCRCRRLGGVPTRNGDPTPWRTCISPSSGGHG